MPIEVLDERFDLSEEVMRFCGTDGVSRQNRDAIRGVTPRTGSVSRPPPVRLESTVALEEAMASAPVCIVG